MLRIIWIVITIFTGLAPGIAIYLISIFIIPKNRVSQTYSSAKVDK
ncbi:MAG: hypothetical protein QMD86_00600 [Patescibacteria group bacterium]|nr:hypothetical protein [Patescibacteria group bacterium]